MYAQLRTSDDPIWDYVDYRTEKLLEKGIDITRKQKFELRELYEIDESLWSGKFLGGDHPAKTYFFVHDPDIPEKICDLLKDALRSKEEVQRDLPDWYYLKWVQARCLRETRCHVRRQQGEEPTETIPPQHYPTKLSQINETLQQAPVDGVARISDTNDPVNLFCRGHRMRLKATKNNNYKPEIDYLEKLLKIRLLELRERVPPIALFLAAGSKFASATFTEVEAGAVNRGEMILQTSSSALPYTLFGASIASWRKANKASRGESSISKTEALCLAFAAATGVTSAGIQLSKKASAPGARIAAYFLDAALQLSLLTKYFS